MSLPRMSLHIGDYLKDTRHLRAAGHGAYFLLILHYWATGGLPDDDKQLAAITCMTDAEWKRWRPVIRAFFKGEGAWRHDRIDAELAAAQAKYEKRSAAGREGGSAPRKTKQTGSNASANTKQPITLTPTKVDGGGGDARGAPLISPEGLVFGDSLRDAIGLDRDDPHAIGIPWTAQKWLNGGWNAALCVETVKRVRANSSKKINSLAYFEKPIAQAHSELAAALPTVIIEAKVIHAQTDQSHPGGAYGASKDRFRAAYAKLSEFADGGEPDDSAGSPGAVEILPAARRQ